MPSEMILLLGVNHKTAPLAIREQLAIGQGGKSYEETLQELQKLDGCRECYLLSTCNRVEIIVVVQENAVLENAGRADIESRIVPLLFGNTVAPEHYQDYLYIHRNIDAVHHLFMVATSLDSMVIGEAQILGQLKEAYRLATEGKGTGPILNKLLHKAFSTAKRVRTETLIGASAVSISYAAVELARKIFGSLDTKSVLLIGAGEMAELAAEHLVSQGVDKVVVANRTLSRATSLAQRFHGSAVSLDALTDQLEQVDIVISSTGAPHLILHKQEMKAIMRARRNEPIFFIDIAVPRDLDPALNELDNVYLYDIDDLHQVVELNKSEREKEAVKARRIVDEETANFQRWLDGLAVVPTIIALRKRANDISQLEIEKALGRLPHLTLEDHQVIEKMALAITAKLLHAPIAYLKDEEGCKERHDEKVEMIRTAFGLEEK
jgi:glutamyl-tRNA reductase